MGFGGIRLCLSLLLAIAVISSASRNTIHPFSVSENGEMVMTIERRSLKARLNDYDDPTANRGHDPPSVSRGKLTKVGGRKG